MSTTILAPNMPVTAAKVTAAELNTRLSQGERFQMIDVRTPQEYAQGHVPGAMNLPMDQAEARLDDLQQRDPVVLICQSGQRARMTCELLKSHHQGLIVLEGGTKAWIDAALPVVKTITTRLSLMRQVQVIAGAALMIATPLAFFVHSGWLVVPALVGVGIFGAGATGTCAMATLLEKMPWNRARS